MEEQEKIVNYNNYKVEQEEEEEEDFMKIKQKKKEELLKGLKPLPKNFPKKKPQKDSAFFDNQNNSKNTISYDDNQAPTQNTANNSEDSNTIKDKTENETKPEKPKVEKKDPVIEEL